MSGADWRQQEELEERQWHEEKLVVAEFVDGQQHRFNGGQLPKDCSKSFMRGWIAQNALQEIMK